MKQLCFSMQVCRDLICPQHSDLQVHRDLALSAFLADNQIQITFCNYIIKHCNLFSFYLPSHHHTDRVANVSTSFMGTFPYSQLSYSRHLAILKDMNCPKQFNLELRQEEVGQTGWCVGRQNRAVCTVAHSLHFWVCICRPGGQQDLRLPSITLSLILLCFDSQGTITPANVAEIQTI